MWPIIVILIIFIILSISLISMLLSDIILIIVNTVILWAVILRAYHEVRNKKILYPYFIALALTFFIFITVDNLIQIRYVLWQVLFVATMLIFAELISLGSYFYKEYEVENKFNTWLDKRKKKK